MGVRIRTLFVVAGLLAFAMTAVPGVEAAKEPVGGCDSGATLEVCSVHCINPPCAQYVCINTVQRICSDQ